MIAAHAPINLAQGVAHAMTGMMTRLCDVSAAAPPTNTRAATAPGAARVHQCATSGRPRRVHAAHAARRMLARATDAQAQRSLVDVAASGTMSHSAAPGAA